MTTVNEDAALLFEREALQPITVSSAVAPNGTAVCPRHGRGPFKAGLSGWPAGTPACCKCVVLYLLAKLGWHRRDRYSQALCLRILGLTYPEIARLWGVSRQRVHQIVRYSSGSTTGCAFPSERV